jgi:hypothetical protein
MKTFEYVSNLFAARDVVHMAHLSTKKYSRHKALGNLYETILEYVDNFVETYQGQHELMDFTIIHAEPVPDNAIVEYLLALIGDVLLPAKKEFATDMDQYGHYVNDIEAFIGDIYHAIYKLRFLE